MTKRRLVVGLGLLACFLVTNRVTQWLVRGDQREDFHEAVDFHRYRPAFEDFVAAHPLADGEQLSGDRLPPSLASFGIVNVYRRGQFVYFVLPRTSLLADDATSEFIRQLDDGSGGIGTILSTTSRNTYHIQRMGSAPRWYFWMHN